MIYLLLWLIQDILQVLMMGFTLVPDIYTLILLASALMPGVDEEKQKKLIWLAFFGGLMWDLRWTNLIGLMACVNVLIIFFVPNYWKKVPAQGRTPYLLAFLLFCSQLFTAASNYIFWSVPSSVAVRLIGIQLILVLPVILLIAYLYKKVYENYV